MGLFENKFIIENISTVLNAGVIAFIISFFLTPFVGLIAKKIKAVDLPASMRNKEDTSSASRINTEPKLKLGGVAIFIGFFISLLITGSAPGFNNGIILGLFIIIFFSFLDDKFELPGKIQLIGQALAAFAVIFSGISITSIHVMGLQLDFDQFSRVIEIGPLFDLGPYIYNFVFPADLITLFWIVGIINVVNWVGGVDALNPSISALAGVTMMLFALDNNNILLATIIGAHVGALVGFIPYNYNPSKIIQGSTGDLLNGYLLAIFAILGGTRWTATFILLGLPILDGLLVVIMRMRSHPEARKNPLKLLSISDKNHLHHRLMAVGYSRKVVLFIEVSMMLVLCSFAIFIGGIRRDVTATLLALVFIFISFTFIFYLKQRKERYYRLSLKKREEEEKRKPVIKIIKDGEQTTDNDDYERFIY